VSDEAPLPTARKALYAAFTTLLVLGGIEIGYRIAGYGRRVVTVPDARVGFRLVPNQEREMPNGARVAINSFGMRDEDFAREKPEGEFRVLLLGDSLTFGIDVDQSEIFARRLDARFAAASGRRVRVMNGAVQGYDSSHQRDWLATFGLDLAPDLVVVMFFPNDIEFIERKGALAEFPGRDLLRLTATFEALEKRHFQREAERLGSSGEADALRARQFRELMKRYTGAIVADPGDDDLKRRKDIGRGILLEMKAMCERRGIGFAVALIPAFASTREPATPNLGAAMEYDLKQAGVKTLNLLPALAPLHATCWLPHDEGHLSAAGHEAVAAALAQWFEGAELLPRP
jgi:lysophospholipase L1-like esterase